MSLHASEYLIQRCAEDARVLHERVATMRRGTRIPGPDAATSERMADACEDIIELLDDLASDVAEPLTTAALLEMLTPHLEARIKQQSHAAVRAVYAGAIARLREMDEVDQRGATPSDANERDASEHDASEHDASERDVPQ